MNLYRRTLLSSACALALSTALPLASRADDAAVQVEGQAFQRHVRIADADLLLNGTGVRQVAWFKGFVAALYLPSRAGAQTQAVAMAGPKRLQIRMLYEVPAAEFVKAFRKGVERNAAPEQVQALTARMDDFSARVGALGKVRKGDVIDLDFEPGRGLAFRLNGTLHGEPIAGDDFYAALLRAFVGDKPYDERLKAGLLGHNA